MKWTVVHVLHLLLWCLTYCWGDQNNENPNLDCDFERDLCEWTETSDSYRTWERTSGKASRYSDTGPSRDHTSGQGHYILLATSTYHSSRKARLYSPVIRTDHDACLSFWYMVHGYDVYNLTLYKGPFRSKKTVIFSKFGPQGKRWYHAMVTLTPGFFTLDFEGTYSGYAGLGDIAMDDITFSYGGACPSDAAELLKNQPRFDCDFEDDLCSWYNVEDDAEFEWIRKTTDVDADDRLALAPFTNGTSYVNLISAAHRGILYVNLRGPTISVGKRGACMSFWYKKLFNLVDKFVVAKHEYGMGKYGTGGVELFATQKENGLTWEHVQITLASEDNFNIVFRAGSFYRITRPGTLAIDDVTISHDGPCPEEKKEAKINCDFDKDFCLWYMASSKSTYDWERGKGPTPSLYTGPDHDHTKGDGYYAYLDASKVDKAVLYSPLMDWPSSCFSFWYYMHGKDVSRLSLNFYEFKVNEDRTELFNRTQTLWTIKGDQGDKWIQHKISLPSLRDTALGFKAVRGYFPRGDIAIDDIRISFEGPCEKDATATTTPSTTLKRMVDTTSADAEKPKLPTPKLTVIGEVDPALESTRVELICDGENNGAEYKWYSQRREGSMELETTSTADITQRKLIFDRIQLDQAGTYWCEVTKLNHLTSDISNKVSINVVPDPRPIPELTTKGWNEAEPAELHDVIRLKCGDIVEGASYHWQTTSPAFLGSRLPNKRTLRFHARPEHSGSYSCYVTKDGYSTAVSRNFELTVTPGKRCTSADSCNGPAYKAECNDMRCECSQDAVIQDNSCELRPMQPKIYTSPSSLEFAYGETYFVICEAQVPVPYTALYSFRRDGEPLTANNELQTSNILKVTNAGDGNSGTYECFVTHRDIDSFHSAGISVKVKDFTNLSCDFAKDLCEWSAQTGPGYDNFSLVPSSAPTGPYLVVPKHKGKETVRAVLKSPTIKRASLESCLSLWYLMGGPDAYSLTVWVFTFSTQWQEDKGERLWTIIGAQEEEWVHKKITVPAGDKFYVAIETLGTVALDEIVFTYRGAC